MAKYTRQIADCILSRTGTLTLVFNEKRDDTLIGQTRDIKHSWCRVEFLESLYESPAIQVNAANAPAFIALCKNRRLVVRYHPPTDTSIPDQSGPDSLIVYLDTSYLGWFSSDPASPFIVVSDPSAHLDQIPIASEETLTTERPTVNVSDPSAPRKRGRPRKVTS